MLWIDTEAWKKITGKDWPTCDDGSDAQADHIIALADGGSDDGSNIQPLCEQDHKDKHKPDKTRWGKRNSRKCEPSDTINLSDYSYD